MKLFQRLTTLVFVGGFYSIALIPRCSAEATELPEDKKQELIQKANAGDGKAAYILFTDLTIDRGDDEAKAAYPWLLLAVKLNNAEAKRLLSMYLDYGKFDYHNFGTTRQEAIENLLKDSAQTYGLSCFDLADDYEKGKFGSKDFVHAREYYLRGAKFNIEFCWYSLAKLCHEGLGGPQDDRTAYYWVSLDANCVDADSMGGKEIWALRKKIAAKLSLKVMQEEWPKIDDYIAKMRWGSIQVYPPPFDSGGTEAKVSADTKAGRVHADTKEREHRRQMEARG